MSTVRGRGFVQCGHFANKWGLQMWMSALLVQKTCYFSKVMLCSHGQEGLS